MASLLEQLPKIVADGKREAERIMERFAIRFDTAWGEPMPVFEAMFERFPAITFECVWQHECENTCHSIERTAGVLLSGKFPPQIRLPGRIVVNGQHAGST